MKENQIVIRKPYGLVDATPTLWRREMIFLLNKSVEIALNVDEIPLPDLMPLNTNGAEPMDIMTKIQSVCVGASTSIPGREAIERMLI